MSQNQNEERPTTTICWHCGGTELVEIRSQRFKVCNNKDCKKRVPWFLDEGQKPVFEATAIDVDYSESALPGSKQAADDARAAADNAKRKHAGVKDS